MQAPNKRRLVGPVVRTALVSLVICGLLFPLAVTGLGQLFFPSQANGELVSVAGCTVGSELIAQQFNSSVFFFPRPPGASASGVDPHILLQAAYDQIPRVSNATGISQADLKSIVDSHIEGTLLGFGTPYVNVLKLNIDLMKSKTAIYQIPLARIAASCAK